MHWQAQCHAKWQTRRHSRPFLHSSGIEPKSLLLTLTIKPLVLLSMDISKAHLWESSSDCLFRGTPRLISETALQTASLEANELYLWARYCCNGRKANTDMLWRSKSWRPKGNSTRDFLVLAWWMLRPLNFLHLLKVLLHQVHHCHHPLNFT